MKRPTWNEYFMILAKAASTRSTCNSRPTGCVIVKDNTVLSIGYNGNISGQEHCNKNNDNYCHRREFDSHIIGEKYDFCVSNHAEANAICFAAKLGHKIEGSKIYCTLFPCITCFKLIYQSGIKEIYYELKYNSNNKNRDIIWNNYIMKTGIIIEKIMVKDDIFINNMYKVTSQRRLIDK